MGRWSWQSPSQQQHYSFVTHEPTAGHAQKHTSAAQGCGFSGSKTHVISVVSHCQCHLCVVRLVSLQTNACVGSCCTLQHRARLTCHMSAAGLWGMQTTKTPSRLCLLRHQSGAWTSCLRTRQSSLHQMDCGTSLATKMWFQWLIISYRYAVFRAPAHVAAGQRLSQIGCLLLQSLAHACASLVLRSRSYADNYHCTVDSYAVAVTTLHMVS